MFANLSMLPIERAMANVTRPLPEAIDSMKDINERRFSSMRCR
jgi:hypothetical protein